MSAQAAPPSDDQDEAGAPAPSDPQNGAQRTPRPPWRPRPDAGDRELVAQIRERELAAGRPWPPPVKSTAAGAE
jgi:hypothetical protein